MAERDCSILLLLSIVIFSSQVQSEKSSCTQTCHSILDETKINVHLIPHSQDDIGWLKTVDQNYYDSEKELQDSGIGHIINSCVEALKSNPNRTFTQIESAFFWKWQGKWWLHQEEEIRRNFVDLVNSGRIEIANAAWSVNDEAAINYQSIIDRYTWGLRKLEETVGECGRPKIGWQIYPFGHSREYASLMKQMGFDGLFIGRIDYADKKKRIETRALDFLWRTSQNLDDSDLFTSVFPETYDCDFIDRVKFHELIDNFTDFHKTRNLMVPMGGDFNYRTVETTFFKIDELIKSFEGHETYNVFYSTPSCYTKSVNDEVVRSKMELPTKSLDFFPYSIRPHEFWAGYFTSRPTAKKFERTGNNILQIAKQLAAFTKIIKEEDFDETLVDLREAVGALQHHDAVTGYAKQTLANEYVHLMSRAIGIAEMSMSAMISSLLNVDLESGRELNFSNCLLSNISVCANTGKDEFWVSVYNPSGQISSHFVRLPVDDFAYEVTDPNNDNVVVPVDLVDAISDFKYVVLTDQIIHPKELVFLANQIPPMGIKLYHVKKQPKTIQKTDINDDEVPTQYGDDYTGFTINLDTGLLDTVTIKGITLSIEQQFFYYVSHDESDGGPSGAYIFRPETSEKIPLSTVTPKISGSIGGLVDEFKQIINEEVTQIIRVYKNNESNYIEFDWLVGNLQIDPTKGGKEIITKFTIKEFENKNIFYTDSNGREQIKREVNKREDYDYDPIPEPVAGNYYPISSKIVLKDEAKKLEVAVLNDRPQGGTSLIDGEIELMIHRRLVNSAPFGINEGLNEEEFDIGLYATGQHFLTFGSIESKVDNGISAAAYERILAQQKLKLPWVMVADASTEANSFKKVKTKSKFQFTGLSKELPLNINILTFEPWKNNTYILRLEHFLEKGEDETLSTDVVINLENLFSDFTLIEAKETILGANSVIEDKENHLKWNSYEPKTKKNLSGSSIIVLRPMEIKTFLIKCESRKNIDFRASPRTDL